VKEDIRKVRRAGHTRRRRYVGRTLIGKHEKFRFLLK
jgi:hypothetical protein